MKKPFSINLKGISKLTTYLKLILKKINCNFFIMRENNELVNSMYFVNTKLKLQLITE